MYSFWGYCTRASHGLVHPMWVTWFITHAFWNLRGLLISLPSLAKRGVGVVSFTPGEPLSKHIIINRECDCPLRQMGMSLEVFVDHSSIGRSEGGILLLEWSHLIIWRKNSSPYWNFSCALHMVGQNSVEILESLKAWLKLLTTTLWWSTSFWVGSHDICTGVCSLCINWTAGELYLWRLIWLD